MKLTDILEVGDYVRCGGWHGYKCDADGKITSSFSEEFTGDAVVMSIDPFIKKVIVRIDKSTFKYKNESYTIPNTIRTLSFAEVDGESVVFARKGKSSRFHHVNVVEVVVRKNILGREVERFVDETSLTWESDTIVALDREEMQKVIDSSTPEEVVNWLNDKLQSSTDVKISQSN